jgi:hypothetical protein
MADRLCFLLPSRVMLAVFRKQWMSNIFISLDFQEVSLSLIPLSLGGWVAKSVARHLATAALWVRIQTSLKNHKWATHSSPPKKYTTKIFIPREV